MKKIKPVLTLAIALLVLTGLLCSGCATLGPEKPKDVVPTDRGTVIFLEKYEFQRPPAGWALLQNLEGGDFELGFLHFEKGDFPSQTTFIYDDEPFGSSRELETRAKQYCTRFLFNSGVTPDIQKQEKIELWGLPAIALYLEGKNPNRAEKARSKVYLFQKGNRILSFVCTQWRPINGSYDPTGFDRFEGFVKSFKFLKKSFYENFEDELKKAGI
ncbi:MAG: hypothetical protein NTY64_18885 [Deltaproteobacteria bacterium]|nr:hypothetical protein [Deltaproteobacteria bacterium]